MFFDGSKSNFNRIFYSITKTKMPGKINLQCTEIKKRGSKVLL